MLKYYITILPYLSGPPGGGGGGGGGGGFGGGGGGHGGGGASTRGNSNSIGRGMSIIKKINLE